MVTWHDAHELLNTRSCAVKGCTGIVYKDGDLCDWHVRNGTPAQYGSPRQPPAAGSVDQLQTRVDELDRQIGRLMEERRRVYRRLTQAQEAA